MRARSPLRFLGGVGEETAVNVVTGGDGRGRSRGGGTFWSGSVGLLLML